MSKCVKLIPLMLVISPCTSQPGKQWLPVERAQSVKAYVAIGENLSNNFDINLHQTNRDGYDNTRYSVNCMTSNTQIYDPLEALVIFVLVKLPVCAVAKVVDDVNNEGGSEISRAAKNPIEQLSEMKSDIGGKFVGGLNDELDVYFPGVRASTDPGITLNVEISNLYLHPKSGKRDKFQLVATFRFCIMDNSENIASYTSIVEAAGKYRSITGWLEMKPDKIDKEIKNIVELGAENIFESLTRKRLSTVFYRDNIPKKC